MPELLEGLDLAGTTVTIDAIGTQKQIAWVIREHYAGYVLAPKAKHKYLFDAVQRLLAQHNDLPHWLPVARVMDVQRLEIRGYSLTSAF